VRVLLRAALKPAVEVVQVVEQRPGRVWRAARLAAAQQPADLLLHQAADAVAAGAAQRARAGVGLRVACVCVCVCVCVRERERGA
jgi:hypothetical protein